MKFPFVGSAYIGRSIAIDGQELINFYTENNNVGSKSVKSLIPTPGLKFLLSIDSLGGMRGMFVTAAGRLLVVVGTKFIEINSDLSTLVLGSLKTIDGRVNFAEVITSTGSFVQLVDGQYGYLFTTETNTFADIPNDGNYQPGTSIISMNGFFIQNTGITWYGGTRFIISGQFDQANTWNAGLDYFTTESSPDPILNIQTINGEVWLLGSQSIEIWYFTGDPDLLFARNSSGVINTGCSGYNSAVSLNNIIAWVGSNIQGNGCIWMASGYIPQKISTNSIDYIINKIGDTSDCIAFTYQREGHQFLIFNFISGDKTLIYDLSTSEWHERANYNKSTGLFEHHRAVMCVLWDSKIIVGDYANGNIYEWDLDTYSDNGLVIRRQRTCQHLHEDRKRLFIHSLEIDMEKGVGLLPTTGPTDLISTEPTVMLQTSNDGGFTWSNELWGSAGRIGNRFARVKFNRLGMSRDKIFRVTFTDPNKFIVVDATLEVTKGNN